MEINIYIKVKLHLLKTKFRILSCQIEVNGLREVNCQSPCPLKTELSMA